MKMSGGSRSRQVPVREIEGELIPYQGEIAQAGGAGNNVRSFLRRVHRHLQVRGGNLPAISPPGKSGVWMLT